MCGRGSAPGHRVNSAGERRPANGRHAALSAVMATGIVSVAARDNGERWLSAGLFAVACALLVVLSVRAARRPVVTIESFAVVAALSMIGVRLEAYGQRDLSVLFAVLAVVCWAAVLLRLRGLGARSGMRLLAVVATEGVAISLLGISNGLATVALAWLVLGFALYVGVIATLPPAHLRDGGGEIWIAMGALAISALAAARVGGALRSAVLDDVALGLWAAASCWGLVLVYAECRWRRLPYESRRWATVFPLGMYATASYAAGRVNGIGGLASVSRVMFWVALAVWALVAAGASRRVLRSLPQRVPTGHAGSRDRGPARGRSEHSLRLAEGARADRR